MKSVLLTTLTTDALAQPQAASGTEDYRRNSGCWNNIDGFLNPETCCPDVTGNYGLKMCFNEFLTVQLCCGPEAFFRDGERDNILGYDLDALLPFSHEANRLFPCSAVAFVPIFAPILNRKFGPKAAQSRCEGENHDEAHECMRKKPYRREDKIIVEIGVLRGEFSAALLKELDFPVQYYAIDPWREPDVESSYYREYDDAAQSWEAVTERGALTKNELHMMNMKSTLDNLMPFWDRVHILQAYSMEALRHFEDGSITFLFLDGNHSAESVEEDLRSYWPKIAPQGIMAGHDWQQEPVKRMVQEFAWKIRQVPKILHLYDSKCWQFTKTDGTVNF